MKKGTLTRIKIFALGLACILMICCAEEFGSGTSGPEFGVHPEIISFTANPSTIKLGEKSTLSWEVKDVTKIEIDEGIGLISGDTGSIEVSPLKTTTYTLTATNAYFQDQSKSYGYAFGSSVTKTCTVVVEK